MKPFHLLGLLMLLSASWAFLGAEVVDSSAGGFTVQHTVEVGRPPQYVFNTLVEGIGKWWDPKHTFSGDASNLSIEADAGGCFCELWGNGEGVRHMSVVNVSPGKRLVLSGGLGPLQQMGVAGSLAFDLSANGSGTQVKLTYSVGGYSPGGLDQWAAPVDSVLTQQLERLKRYTETGSADEKPQS